jgi:hypothetical protein
MFLAVNSWIYCALFHFQRQFLLSSALADRQQWVENGPSGQDEIKLSPSKPKDGKYESSR